MRRLCVAMAALAAAATAAPAAAQYGPGEEYRQDVLGRGFADLRLRVDEGLRSGRIGRDEAFSLDEEMRMLARLEDHYRRDGLSGWERGDLQRRLVLLRDRIRYVESLGRRGEIPGYGGQAYEGPGYERGWEDPGAPPPPVDRPLPRSDEYGSGEVPGAVLPDARSDDRDWQGPDMPPDDERWQEEVTDGGQDQDLGDESIPAPDADGPDDVPADEGAEDEDWDDSDWEYEPI